MNAIHTAPLLFELGTEELPPIALLRFIAVLEEKICQGLSDANISFNDCQSFATPRRLALLINNVAAQQSDQTIERRGPSLDAAYPNGRDAPPSKAAEGFARSCQTSIDQLSTIKTDKGEWLAYTIEEKGQPLSAVIEKIIEHALDTLPIPKRMRWGNNKTQFVRPVHWSVLMHGDTVIPASILATQTSNKTHGHRFHSTGEISIPHANDYQSVLKSAYVIADFAERKKTIKQQATAQAEKIGGHAKIDEALLNEVTALVEWPVALAAEFESRFLDVPQEALIYTMESNQKYFTVLDDNGKLMPWFITISNIDSQDKRHVIEGNQRVVRPRLSDAAFFFAQDKKKTLSEHAVALKKMIFQKQLGTLADKNQRLAALAKSMATSIGADPSICEQAGALAKADLVTDMVNEFASLQGTMGYYYALHEGKPENFARALAEQYLPRFSGDSLPETAEGMALSLADKLDTLVGIIGIGQIPSGDKDPFALRRASLGIMRIVIEKKLPLDIRQLIEIAYATFTDLGFTLNADTVSQVMAFFEGRYRAWYHAQGISAVTVQAVQATGETVPMLFDARVKAVTQFSALNEAQALAAANKRVSNILAKATTDVNPSVDPQWLQQAEEQALWQAIQDKQRQQTTLIAQQNYTEALTSLADLREPVDQFFDNVMVNDENADLKNNRLALLKQLNNLFTAIADISLLSIK